MVVEKNPSLMLKEAKLLIDKWDFSIKKPSYTQIFTQANNIALEIDYYEFINLLDTLAIGETLPPNYFAVYTKNGANGHLFTNFTLLEDLLQEDFVYSYNIIDLVKSDLHTGGWLKVSNFGLRFHRGGSPGRPSSNYRFYMLKDRHNFLNWSITPF